MRACEHQPVQQLNQANGTGDPATLLPVILEQDRSRQGDHLVRFGGLNVLVDVDQLQGDVSTFEPLAGRFHHVDKGLVSGVPLG